MATLIKGGTIVTAERSFRGDVLCDEGKIVQVGDRVDAVGADVIDAGGAFVMPGGIDPHTHMELPFMGTVASEDFYSGHVRGHGGRHHDDHRFRHSEPTTAHHGRLQPVARMGAKSRRRLLLPRGDHLVGRQRARGHGNAHARAWRQQLQALHGLQGRHHVRRRSAGEQLHPGPRARRPVHRARENGELVYRLQQEIFDRGITGPEGHPLSRPPEVEGEAANRAIRIAEVSQTPLYLVHTSCIDALEAVTRARLEGQRVFAEVLAQHLVINDSGLPRQGLAHRGAPRHEPAVPAQGPPGTRCGKGSSPACCRPRPRTTAASARRRKEAGKDDFRSSPTAPTASRTAWRCCGTTACAPGG